MSEPVRPYWVGNVAYLRFPVRPFAVTADEVANSFLGVPAHRGARNWSESRFKVSGCRLSDKAASTATAATTEDEEALVATENHQNAAESTMLTDAEMVLLREDLRVATEQIREEFGEC